MRFSEKFQEESRDHLLRDCSATTVAHFFFTEVSFPFMIGGGGPLFSVGGGGGGALMVNENLLQIILILTLFLSKKNNK